MTWRGMRDILKNVKRGIERYTILFLGSKKALHYSHLNRRVSYEVYFAVTKVPT